MGKSITLRTATMKKYLLLAVMLVFASPAFAQIATGDATLDRYDELFLAAAQKYSFPDVGYAKAMAVWESNQKLEAEAVSDDSPCGGSGVESKSIGIFQVTPGCGEGRGHSAAELMDPALNIDVGMEHLVGIYKDMENAHPGCTQRQYLNMTGAGWVQNYETITGCDQYTDERQQNYVDTVGALYEKWYGTSTQSQRGKIDRRQEECDATRSRYENADARQNGLTARQLSAKEASEKRCEAEASERGDVTQPVCSEATKSEIAAFCSAAGFSSSQCARIDFSAVCDPIEEITEPAVIQPTPVPAIKQASYLGSAGAGKGADRSSPSVSPINGVQSATGELIFEDEFEGAAGALPGEHWKFFDAWGSGQWRDAQYDDNHARLNGKGQLVITGERGADGKLVTSYLQAYDQANLDGSNPAKFGPGTSLEIVADVSGCSAPGSAAWCAGWSFDPTDPYDGNPKNGTEIDIFEYTCANEWSCTRYTSGNHIAKGGVGSEGKWIEGADPSQPGMHTYRLDWYQDKLVYFFDGREVQTVTNGVSGSNNQATILSIENAAGTNGPWAPGTTTPENVTFLIDSVKARKL